MAHASAIQVLVAAGGGHEARLVEAVKQDTRLALLETVNHAAAAVGRAAALAPDVVVLDEELEDGALAAVVEIAARLPTAAIVVAHDGDGSSLIDAFAAGASAYVGRNTPAKQLAHVIVEVAGGEVVLSREQLRRVAAALRDPARPRRRLEQLPELTAREWQVLELIQHSFSTPEIAERLVVSPVTVRSHARAIRKKLARQARDTSHHEQ